MPAWSPSVDGDTPEEIATDGTELADRLFPLVESALKPWDENDTAPENFDDGWVDLLQVACGYFGLRPALSDVSGPVLGAPVDISRDWITPSRQ